MNSQYTPNEKTNELAALSFARAVYIAYIALCELRIHEKQWAPDITSETMYNCILHQLLKWDNQLNLVMIII